MCFIRLEFSPQNQRGLEVVDLFKMIQKSRFSKHQITFVCDGTPSQECPVGNMVQTIFTGPHRTADDEIMAPSSTRLRAARSMLVVTSDREIIRSKSKLKVRSTLVRLNFFTSLVEDNRIPELSEPYSSTNSGLSSARGCCKHGKNFLVSMINLTSGT